MGLKHAYRVVIFSLFSLLSVVTLYLHISTIHSRHYSSFKYIDNLIPSKDESRLSRTKSVPSQLPVKNDHTEALSSPTQTSPAAPKNWTEIKIIRQEKVPDICPTVTEHYWGIVSWLKGNNTPALYVQRMSPEGIRDLKEYFKQGALWGNGHRPPSVGVDRRTDCRTLAQVTWTYLGGFLFPDLILSKGKVKTIAARPDSAWFGHQGTNILLQCPGSFNGTCKLLSGWAQGSVNAILSSGGYFPDTQENVPENTSMIYYELESPYNTGPKKFKRQKDFLASYWRGSDIIAPYAAWTYYDPSVRSKKQDRDYALRKTKMAAAMISHCGTPNKRLEYIRELSKHIQVDVYGSCGKLRCSRNNNDECFKMLQRDYRFYLAFENCNCRDYVTEKLFLNALGNDVVPVVMGGHPADYEALAPKHSYIHVDNYKSPEELAKFLLHLSESQEEYNKYFEWKGTGDFIDTKFMCRTCAMLWYADLKPPDPPTKPLNWGSSADKSELGCMSPGTWHWDAV